MSELFQYRAGGSAVRSCVAFMERIAELAPSVGIRDESLLQRTPQKETAYKRLTARDRGQIKECLDRGMPQYAIAAKLGLSQSTVSRIAVQVGHRAYYRRKGRK